MAWRKPSNLREWFETFLRHKKKFFFCALPVAVVVVVASHYIERKYTASVVMEMGKDLTIQQMDPTVTKQASHRMRRLLEHDITSTKAIKAVIEDLDLTRDLPHFSDGELTHKGQMVRGEMIDKIRRGIAVRYLERTNQVDIVRVSATDLDRDLATKIANRLVDNYINHAWNLFDRQLSGAHKFFKDQVARYSTLVGDAQTKYHTFITNHPGLAPDNPLSVDVKLVELRSEHKEIEKQYRLAASTRRKLHQFVQDQPEWHTKTVEKINPEIAYLVQQKNEYERQLLAFKATPGAPKDSHPRAKRLLKAIEQLNGQIAQTIRMVEVEEETEVNTTRLEAMQKMREFDGQVAALESMRATLEQRIRTYEDRQRNFHQLRNEFERLRQHKEDAEEQHAFWRDRWQKTDLALRAALGNRSVSLRVIDRPREYLRPSHPRISNILMLAILLGGGSGIGLIVLSEMLDHSFHSVQHAVDELKLPVLGTVDEILTPPMLFRRKVFSWGVYPVVCAVLLISLVVSVFLANLSLADPSAYEQLRSHPGQMIGEFVLGESA